MGNGSGAARTHRAGHAVLRGPLDVNGQGRHGTGVWMRKTRIRFATRAYRSPNDPLPRSRNNFWGWSVTNSPSFECRSNPIACPAPIREGARRVCRTPMTLGVATRSCPPTIDARVCRAPATPRRNGRLRPLEPAGGPVAGYLSGSAPQRRPRTSQKTRIISRVPRPTSTRGHESIRFFIWNLSVQNCEIEGDTRVLVRKRFPADFVTSASLKPIRKTGRSLEISSVKKLRKCAKIVPRVARLRIRSNLVCTFIRGSV